MYAHQGGKVDVKMGSDRQNVTQVKKSVEKCHQESCIMMRQDSKYCMALGTLVEGNKLVYQITVERFRWYEMYRIQPICGNTS